MNEEQKEWEIIKSNILKLKPKPLVLFLTFISLKFIKRIYQKMEREKFPSFF